MDNIRYPEHLVFGLDIGTRSIVGTVGYKENTNNFVVVAQCIKMHTTRAMMDGQIHDILKVSETIRIVKKELEAQIGRELKEVSIAAAGRVLKTVTCTAEYEFPSEIIVNEEHIHSLDLIGVEKAYATLRDELKEDKINFYCVGYSVIKYYLNGYVMSKLEGHKASKIATEILATFLPDEVIDGLYAAVEKAGLLVSNLTLEPIAAINVAIPEKFRLLNIALVDVGAGTSDLSITKDGSIIAYGMIPYAGDEITEAIVEKYLVEFNVAEAMKISAMNKKKITYKDIMGISHKIDSKVMLEDISETIHKITKSIATKIIELNGNKSVSAVFIVGGGGKVPEFVSSLADELNLSKDRVALRGAEVLQEVTFLQDIKKDPLLVTPIGICLNYYDKTNNFIFVNINGERIKLYDNNKLTIVDAAIGLGFPNEKLFPRRGKPINFALSGTKRLVRGELGEAAIVKLNGEIVGLSSSIVQNDRIEIIESTIGRDAVYEVRQLPEYHSTITFQVNGQTVICPKFVLANEKLVSEFYNIKDNDEISILNYYTLEQILEFMDLKVNGKCLVNNVYANLTEKVYENFSIQIELNVEKFDYDNEEDLDEIEIIESNEKLLKLETNTRSENNNEITVIVNKEQIKLFGKINYIYVDVFDYYPFDLTRAAQFQLVTTLNGETADFTTPIKEKDVIELYWKE